MTGGAAGRRIRRRFGWCIEIRETPQNELAAVLSPSSNAVDDGDHSVVTKRKMSTAGRARIAAAQKARWAKLKKSAVEPTSKIPAKKKKRKLSPERRARIIAATKARWARAKANK
jgi:hypothetical protein